MKKTILLLNLGLLFSSVLYSQDLVRPNKPNPNLDPNPGFITINDFNAGFGLGITSTPYSKFFFGITSVNGYQINDMFMVGGGTGVLFYNEGTMIPLYLDMRFRFKINRLTPYASAAGGVLFNLEDFDKNTAFFVNPSAGVRYSLTDHFGLNAGVGLWMQIAPELLRASFINLRLGAVYKF